MPAEANLQTSATLSADVVAEYIQDRLLERPEKQTVFWALAEKATQPKGSGKVSSFVRYERLPLPIAPLEEGVTPTATPMTLSTVQAVLEQWGAFVNLSDVAQLVVSHPLVQQAKEVLNLQHKETLDREVQFPLLGSSAVTFAGGKASRALLVAADVIGSDDIRRVTATLRQNGARYYAGTDYYGIHDPYIEADLSKDSTFVLAAAESQVDRLNDMETGRWLGVRWMRSNLIPIITLLPATNVVTTALTGGGIPAGGVGFDGPTGATVRTRVTMLDPQTAFETQISDETSTTNAAVFGVQVQIAAAAPSGVYFVYSTMQNGLAGTATRQVRVNHVVGTANNVQLVKSGAPTALNAFVVTASGAVAPATPPTGMNVHVTYICGKGAFGTVTLNGLKTYMTEPDQATDSDPLAQRTKCSWKQLLKGLVLNPDFFRRIESASAFN
jgi:N4-gp56 family major capsid protein